MIRIAVPGAPAQITLVGNIYKPQVGESIEAEGEWTDHPRFGRQFKVRTYRVLLPATLQGIEDYLATGNIRGIGQELARRLVEKFGERTLEVIDAEPNRLLEVPGIGAKRLEMIQTAWQAQAGVRNILVHFQGLGLTPRLALLIYQRLGADAPKIAAENPYRLAWEVQGIGFKTADEIAARMGIAPDSPMRAEAGLLHVLGEAERQGHCHLPESQLLESAAKLLAIDETILAGALETDLSVGRLVREDGIAGRPVYTPALRQAEESVADRLRILATTPRLLAGQRIENAVVDRALGAGVELTDEQRDALQAALEHKVAIITGGPGVGKTTILRNLVRIYVERGLGDVVHLAAPTGRAAKRLHESTGHPAKTIHRLLSFNPHKMGFEFDEKKPLETILVVIDEASMLDVRLAGHLLAAIPPGAGLVLIGDVDQLPSVGPGNVLRDLIGSGTIPCRRLTRVFRQESTSRIVENAHRINQGMLPVVQTGGDETELRDFYFIRRDDPEEAARTVLELVTERIPTRFGFDPFTDVQVITPMHKGEVGTIRLNELLQDALNPRPERFQTLAGKIRPGDKVMQTVNNYEREVFNGDIGRVESIDPESYQTFVRFDQRSVSYNGADLGELSLSYCVTVHKSQGSEYPAVVMPLLTQHYMLLQRNLVYTGLTRGKKLVVIVGDEKALGIAIRNDRPHHRYTRLEERLQARFGP